MPRFPGKLRFWLVGYGLCLFVACLAVYRWISVNREPATPKVLIHSWWKDGRRVDRELRAPGQGCIQCAAGARAGATEVVEAVVAEGPILGTTPLLFGASFVPERDGVKIEFHTATVYLTPDDLLQRHAYDREADLLGVSIVLGVDRDIVLQAAAVELKTEPARLLAEARMRRVAVRSGRTQQRPVPDRATLQTAVNAASDYLARQVQDDGTFRYEVDAITNEPLPDYNWPRHAGATWFLARAAAYARVHRAPRPASTVDTAAVSTPNEHERLLASSVVRAANKLINEASLRCGAYRCIGEGSRVDIGTAALTVMALCDLHKAQLVPGLLPIINELTGFIRNQQRPDGEFAHTYDRDNSRVIDEQFPYYSGEATLALSQAHLVTRNPADLLAAARALDYLVTRPPLYVTWRYLWAAEHWTCQAVTDLWQRAPNDTGKEFCLAWQRFNRAASSRDPEYAGAAGRFLFRSVPLTGTGSSTEAAVATLALSRLTQMPAAEVRDLELGIRRSLALLLRYQFSGSEHLMRDPAAMRGGMPASTADLRVRIDYPQHAGSAWLSYLHWLQGEPWEL